MIQSRLRRSISLRTWIALALVWVLGCATEEMPKTYSVKGKVVFKSGKPMQGGNITFMSVADPELRGYGTIAKDGTFALGTIAHTSKGKSQNLEGAVEGDFRVNIYPGGGEDDPKMLGVAAAGRPFTLKKTYKVEAKESNEITVVVE